MEGNKFVQIILTIIFVLFFIMFILGSMIPLWQLMAPNIIKIDHFSNIRPISWISLAVVIFLIYIISTYNGLVALKKKVEQSKSGVDVYLKQRFDLIPNVVETVKGYAKYEEDVLEKIIKIRNEYSKNSQDNMKVNATLNEEYNKLIAVVENYPELKANEPFLNLQKQLSKIESQLQAARRIYNSDVTEYNTKVQSFPSNVIATIFKFKEIALFEIDALEKKNINIEI